MKTKNQSLFIALAILAGVNHVAAQASGNVLFQTLVSFTYTNGPYYGQNGGTATAGHSGAMIQANDGNFYGTTTDGGPSGGGNWPGSGTVFRLAPGGEFTTLYIFGNDLGGGILDGQWPQGNLIQGTDGSLWGTTQYGGDSNGQKGNIFSITTNGGYSTFTFPGAWPNFPDGENPVAGVIQGSDGGFYGVTVNGTDATTNEGGAIFKFSNGIFTNLYTFPGYPMGDEPIGELVEGNDGNFYGTTRIGGIYDYGTLFRISPDGVFTNLAYFSETNGGNPVGGLCKGKDGCIYGTTESGGSGGGGTIFRLTTNGCLKTLYQFGTQPEDGAAPTASLIQASDGNFYGTTELTDNCCNEYGTIFRITTNGVLTTLYRFSTPVGGVGRFGGNTDGINPEAGLVQGHDGSFYGTTAWAGQYGYGTIFRLTILPQFQPMVQASGSIKLTMSVMPGQTCQIQYNTNLASTNWINFGSAVTATNTTACAVDSMTNLQCFYRIALLQ